MVQSGAWAGNFWAYWPPSKCQTGHNPIYLPPVTMDPRASKHRRPQEPRAEELGRSGNFGCGGCYTSINFNQWKGTY